MLKCGPYSFHSFVIKPCWNQDLTLSTCQKTMSKSGAYPFHICVIKPCWYLNLTLSTYDIMCHKIMLKSQPYPFHIDALKPCWNLNLTLSTYASKNHAEIGTLPFPNVFPVFMRNSHPDEVLELWRSHQWFTQLPHHEILPFDVFWCRFIHVLCKEKEMMSRVK